LCGSGERERAPEVSDLVKGLKAHFKLVGSLGWASRLFEDAVDDVSVDRAGKHHENVVVGSSDGVALAM